MNKNKNTLVLFAFYIITVFSAISCESSTEPVTSGTGGGSSSTNLTVVGTVKDASSGNAIDSALIRIIYTGGTKTTYTNTSGTYSASFNIDISQVITVIISKVNYKTDTSSAFVTKNAINNLAPVSLSKVTTGSGSTTTGPASAIYLLSQTSTSIGVRAGGSPETGKVTFVVVDSAGNPISFSNSALVKFTLAASPNGGEFIYPNFVYTDTAGKASVFLTSGTKAGVVQIQAEIDMGGKKIISQPVSYTIHGGLPDFDHFGLASQFLNFAGYNIFGLTNGVTAYVGDKYGNPVRPGTSVYFTTTGGLIPGSQVTNEIGLSSVNLMSAEPRPTHPTRGPGFAIITAHTADENNNTITKDIEVLFSGVPTIIATPSSFNIPNGGSQVFNYEVKDQNGNPLAPATQITVAVEGEGVKASGDLTIEMPDTQSKSYTRFSFIVSDAVDTTDKVENVYIKINTSGPNGRSYYSFSGTAR
ncbi:MAG: Ig-like domain-containing protein [Ignavibacteriaceae bacterium]|nr:Ig-like domain-containing protein [Ignavibacteriaceae bacterium]